MPESQSPRPSPSGGLRHSPHRFPFRRAGLLLATPVLVCLLIAACTTSAASPAPVKQAPIAAVPVSLDANYAPLPVSSPASGAIAAAPPMVASATLGVAASEEFVGRAPAQSRTAEPPTAVTFGGRNRFSIPTLGINSAIGSATCGELIPNGIWYWPCAGRNNLYLMGHAWGVFAPLHDGYHSGLLTSGLTALYADGAGVIHRYRLLWVEDLPVATWGQGATWAATAGPVITLQTCDGATDNYRIMVRFVPA